MRDDRCAGAADVLRHADSCTVHLRPVAFAAQLLGDLHDLVHPRRTDRMPACFESAAGADGHASSGADLVIETEPHALTAFGESARLEREEISLRRLKNSTTSQ